MTNNCAKSCERCQALSERAANDILSLADKLEYLRDEVEYFLNNCPKPLTITGQGYFENLEKVISSLNKDLENG